MEKFLYPINFEKATCLIENPYGYIYVTTDHQEHKYYIGKRKCERKEGSDKPWVKTFWANYYGSGKTIRAIAKERPDTLSVIPLEYVASKQELNAAERRWIAAYDAADSDLFYNCQRGGDGGALTKDALTRMSNAKLGSVPWNKGIPMRPETHEKLSKALRGRVLSEEHRKHISEGQKGKKMSEEAKLKISRAHMGMKSSPEAIEKMRKSRMGKCAGDEHWTKDPRNAERVAEWKAKSKKSHEKITGGLSPKAKPVYVFRMDGSLAFTFSARSEAATEEMPQYILCAILNFNDRNSDVMRVTMDGYIYSGNPDFQIKPNVRTYNRNSGYEQMLSDSDSEATE